MSFSQGEGVFDQGTSKLPLDIPLDELEGPYSPMFPHSNKKTFEVWWKIYYCVM